MSGNCLLCPGAIALNRLSMKLTSYRFWGIFTLFLIIQISYEYEQALNDTLDEQIHWIVHSKCLCCCCIEHAVRIWPALWRTYVMWGWDSKSSSKYLCSEGRSPSLKLGGSKSFDASLFMDTQLCVGDCDLFSVKLRNRKNYLRAIECCSGLRHSALIS